MSTIFYAVQCCQCSTMQVKQRKTSSKNNNKWTCVVCNQKQSARKVFAESPMARDLRPFVQSSNMARQFTQQDQQQHRHEEHAFVSDGHECGARKKRRTDWTEYLDGEAGQHGETKQEDEESGGYEPQVVTDLPPELLKKPKMSRCFDAYGSGDKENGGAYELQNRTPVMSMRNSNKHVLSPADLEDWRCELTMNKNTSDCSLLMLQEKKESRSLQVTNATLTGASKWNDYVSKDDNDGLASKWNDYVTKDDNEGFRIINRKSGADNTKQWSNETIANYEYEMITTDERVEDDIHPDFLQG